MVTPIAGDTIVNQTPYGLFDHNIVVDCSNAVGIFGDHTGEIFRVLGGRHPAQPNSAVTIGVDLNV